MPDPIVGITNGVPTSGTGNITTLGQTLIDGANIAIGATTDLAVVAGAVGSLNGKLRAISRDIAGGIVLQAGGNVIGAVTQSGGPWSVSGTVAATQSGAWNIGNITGTVSLPTGAATAALQPSNAAIASATSGQTGNLAMGAVTTGAPAYTNATSNVLSLTTTGALRVDGSAVTQPVSGTVAISGTVAVTESGTWTVQPGNTANTTPWLMTVNQGGNSATVSAAGALKVDGSGVTQPISAASLPLPAGAATAALQPSNAAQGSTTTGQTGPLVQAAVTTAAPTYTTGQTSPLSLTTAGALRVDGSGITQPVSGTVTANQGGTWNQRLQDGLGNAITSDARGSARPLAVEILDASGNQITSFGAGSGPSFGSAFPTTGTAIGMKDSAGVNMVAFNANAAGALKVDGSATTQPVSGTFWQTTQPVSGTFWQATQPISAAALPLPAGAATSANQATAAAIGSTTSGQTGGLAFGAVTTGLPAYTTAQSDPLSLTTTGLLRVDGSNVTQPISGNVGITGTVAATQSGTWNITNISGTVSLPTGAATSANQPTNAALGSTTTGQTGHLSLGAVTTAAPSYTSGQSNALSLTTTGALRTDASATTQPISGSVTASQGGTWTMQPGNTANTTPWLATINQGGNSAAVTASSALKVDGSAVTQPVSGTLTANQGGNWTDRIVGNAGGIFDFAGQNVSAPANAILMGGEFNTTPTTITSGNASPFQLDSAGNLKVNVSAGGASGGTSSSFAAAFPGTGTAAGAEYLSTPPSLVSGNMAALQVDSSGNLKVNIQAGAGSGGTASNFNATFPTAGTAAGAEYLSTPPSLTSGQMVALQTDASGNLKVNIQAGAGSGGTASNFGAAFPASGTAAGAQYLSTPPTLTSGNMAALQVTAAGSLHTTLDNASVAVTGTFWQTTQPVSAASLPLPAGASTSANQPSNAGIGSTTSGQTGTMAMGAVTTGAPTYTTAQSNPLSLNTAGGLRVDGSGVTQPVSGTFWQATQPVSGTVAVSGTVTVTGTVAATQSGTWTVQPGNTANTTAWLVTGAGGTFPITAAALPLPSGAATAANQTNVQGVIGAATAPASMGVIGGVFNTTKPTLTTGQSSAIQLNSSGIQLVDGSAVTQPVSGTFWQATQPVSGTVTVTQATAANLLATVNLRDGSGNLLNSSSGNLATTTASVAASSLTTGFWSSATGVNTALNLGGGTITTYTTITGQITQTTTITGGAVTFEESFDGGTTFKQLPAGRLIDPSTGAALSNPYTFVASANQAYQIITSGAQNIRARLSTAIVGTGTVNINGCLEQTASTLQVFSPVAAGFNATVTGDTAFNVADAGNPLKIGGVAYTSQPSAVSTNGFRTNASFDKQGKIIAVGAIRQLKGVQKTSISVATETTVVTAGAANVFQDVYAITVTNKSATAVFVDFRDATAGTIRMTLAAPAGDTRGFTVPVDSAMVQSVAANNWTATVSSAVTSIEITMLYVSNL